MYRVARAALVATLAICLSAGSAWQRAGAQTSRPATPESVAATVPGAIVEQVINHSALQQFLHPRVPGRVPLVLSSHLLDPRLSLRKFGKPVQVVPGAQLKKGIAYLRFTGFTLKQNVATVEIRYNVEGVGGRFIFQRDGNLWRLLKASVWEA